MHILFLTDNFPPEVNAPATRTFEHCREWVKAGHTVTIITCAPNFPKGKVYDGYRNRFYSSENVEGIRVIRVWTYIAANSGFMKRILDYISFMIAAIFAAPFVRRVDIVVGTSPQFFTACAACIVSFYKRIPFVFELRDIWPESIKAVGAMKDSGMIRVLERIELFLYKRAKRIVSVTHAFKQTLIARGVDGGKIDVVTNGVDVSRFQPQSKDKALERELGLEGKFVAGYIGTHGMAHHLETLVLAANKLSKLPNGQDYHILFLGDGARKKALVEMAENLGLSNLTFVDSVTKDEVVRYWSVLDVSIIHLRKSDLFKTVIPSKLFECMGMGLPVLQGVQGESADIVEREGVGMLFEPENADALCARLVELRSDPKKYMTMKNNGLLAAEKYNRSSLALNMLERLETALSSN